jgi:hypothetical protein
MKGRNGGRMNKSEWYKIPLVCGVKLVSMLVFQNIIRGWLLGKMLHLLPGGPPDSDFLFRISVFSVVTAGLFTFVYLVVGNKMSINGSVKRAVIFGLLIYFSSYLPQSMGLIGAGGNELIMSFSVGDAIFDFLSFLVTFAFMGWIFKTENSKQRMAPRQNVIKTMLAGGLLLPVMMIGITQAIAVLFPSQNMISILRISPEFEWSFYASFYLCFVMTGVLVPLFYYVSDYNKKVSHKGVKFALKYSLLIWAPIVFAMVAFGVEILPCVIFSFESIIVFLVLVRLCDYILMRPVMLLGGRNK